MHPYDTPRPSLAHSSLARLNPGERVEGRYRIQVMRRPRLHDPSIHWEILLADHSGELTCYATQEDLCCEEPLPPHTVVHALFHTRRRGTRIIARLDTLDPDPRVVPAQAVDLLPRHHCRHPDAVDELVRVVRNLRTAALRRFADQVLAHDAVARAFLTAASGTVARYTSPGGLLRQSLETVGNLVLPKAVLPCWHDLARVGALFRDLGELGDEDRTLLPDPQQTRWWIGDLTNTLCLPALRGLQKDWPEGAHLLWQIWDRRQPCDGPAPQTAIDQCIQAAVADTAIDPYIAYFTAHPEEWLSDLDPDDVDEFDPEVWA